MAKNAAAHPSPAPSPANRAADSGPALAPVIEINLRHIGRTPQPGKLTGSEAPEGWIKKIERPQKEKKTLGPPTMAKHEVQQKPADYIKEYTGKLVHQGESIGALAARRFERI